MPRRGEGFERALKIPGTRATSGLTVSIFLE